jgi:hypothetical protein
MESPVVIVPHRVGPILRWREDLLAFRRSVAPDFQPLAWEHFAYPIRRAYPLSAWTTPMLIVADVNGDRMSDVVVQGVTRDAEQVLLFRFDDTAPVQWSLDTVRSTPRPSVRVPLAQKRPVLVPAPPGRYGTDSAGMTLLSTGVFWVPRNTPGTQLWTWDLARRALRATETPAATSQPLPEWWPRWRRRALAYWDLMPRPSFR